MTGTLLSDSKTLSGSKASGGHAFAPCAKSLRSVDKFQDCCRFANRYCAADWPKNGADGLDMRFDAHSRPGGGEGGRPMVDMTQSQRDVTCKIGCRRVPSFLSVIDCSAVRDCRYQKILLERPHITSTRRTPNESGRDVRSRHFPGQSA